MNQIIGHVFIPITNNFSLKHCLFGTVKLVRNAIKVNLPHLMQKVQRVLTMTMLKM